MGIFLRDIIDNERAYQKRLLCNQKIKWEKRLKEFTAKHPVNFFPFDKNMFRSFESVDGNQVMADMKTRHFEEDMNYVFTEFKLEHLEIFKRDTELGLACYNGIKEFYIPEEYWIDAKSLLEKQPHLTNDYKKEELISKEETKGKSTSRAMETEPDLINQETQFPEDQYPFSKYE